MSSRVAHDPDAALLEDDDLDLRLDADPRNPHASSTRWRHEESSAFRRHAGQSLQPRPAEAKTGTHDLADFLNSMRVAPDGSATSRSRSGSATPIKHTPIMVDDNANAVDASAAAASPAAAEHHLDNHDAHSEPQDGKTVVCGPLLNYRRTDGNTWVGSVLIVTRGGGKAPTFVPTLLLRRFGEAQHAHANGAGAATNGHHATNGTSGATEAQGQCLYSDARNTFWRFDLRCEMEPREIKWEYTLPDTRFSSKTKPRANGFYVPANTESMRSAFDLLLPDCTLEELMG